MKAIIKIAYMCITLIVFSATHAANIESVEVVDVKTFHVSMSEVKMATDEIVGDVKVLNDISIGFTTQDEQDNSTVIITLNQPLEKNTEYSLLTVFGADGSIDFETTDSLEGIEIMNSEIDEVGQYIDSIMLVDLNSIAVTYSEELSGEDFEFKLLSDLEVAGINPVDEDTIEVKLASDLNTNKNYILMVLALQDALSQDVELEEGIYNFLSGSRISKGNMISEPEFTQAEETQSETIDTETFDENLLDEEEIDLNAAYNQLDTPDESNMFVNIDAVVEDAVQAEERAQMQAEAEVIDAEEVETEQTELVRHTLESVALSATATPETGAETTLLIILTLFINTFYYFSRRKAS